LFLGNPKPENSTPDQRQMPDRFIQKYSEFKFLLKNKILARHGSVLKVEIIWKPNFMSVKRIKRRRQDTKDLFQINNLAGFFLLKGEKSSLIEFV
jgi:hypothetical protein